MRSPADLLLRATLAFLVMTSGFFAVTLYVETRLARSDPARDSMAENALPSIRHLSSAWSELHQSEERTLDAVTGSDAVADGDRAQAARERRDAELQLYSALPYFPEEIPLFEKVKRDLIDLDAATNAALGAATQEEKHRTLAALHLVGNRADMSLDKLIDVDVRNAQSLMREVGQAHQQAEHAVVLLDIVAAVLGAALTALAVIIGGRLASMRRAREELVQRRASELETFSARVAHDILSPLGAVSFALELAARDDTDGQSPASVDRRKEILRRGQSSLARAREVVDALLDFARSGAQPKARASSEVALVMEEVANDARLTQPEFKLVVDASPDLRVACAKGVTTSLVSNLVNNALRYGGGTTKQIVLRARENGECARLEIEDSGQGLPAGAEQTIFLPYVQAETGSAAGLGLGLATVKRLAEAHGGACGVVSKPGAGCTFWVSLPLARFPATDSIAPSTPTLAPTSVRDPASDRELSREREQERHERGSEIQPS